MLFKKIAKPTKIRLNLAWYELLRDIKMSKGMDKKKDTKKKPLKTAVEKRNEKRTKKKDGSL